MLSRCLQESWALKIFESPWVRPRLLLPKFLMGFCSDRSYECAYKIKFVALPISEIIGVLRKLGSPYGYGKNYSDCVRCRLWRQYFWLAVTAAAQQQPQSIAATAIIIRRHRPIGRSASCTLIVDGSDFSPFSILKITGKVKRKVTHYFCCFF